MCREKEEKVGLVWHSSNYTVSYRRQKTWWFEPQLSVGPLTDIVTTLNLPMLAASDDARGNFFMELGLMDIFTAMEVRCHLSWARYFVKEMAVKSNASRSRKMYRRVTLTH